MGDGLSSPWGGAVARFKRFKRRILATNKHAHKKPIAVLKNPMQNATYMHPIQGNMEKLIHNVCERA
jgi:hypothetical protein